MPDASGSSVNSAQQTVDGGYIITGALGCDAYLLKIDENGFEQWLQILEEEGCNIGRSVKQTNDGGYIIAGDANADVSLIKTNENGIIQWTQIFEFPIVSSVYSSSGYSVFQTSDGGFIISGETYNLEDLFDGNHGFIIKTDGNGIEEWNHVLSYLPKSGLDSSPSSVVQTTDGGYVISGTTHILNGITSIFLIKTDGNGIEQWLKTYNVEEYPADFEFIYSSWF